MTFFSTLLSGMLVGAADIVPGISGGTVAFVIGIYEELLASIASFNLNALKLLFRGQFRSFFASVSWKFLLVFVCGVGFSFITLAKGFQYLLNDETLRPWLYSAFMGLVIGSSFFCARLIPAFSYKAALCLILGAVAAYLLTGSSMVFKPKEPTYNVPLHCRIVTTKPLTNYDGATNTLLNAPESLLVVLVAKRQLSREAIVYNAQSGKARFVHDVLNSKRRSFVDLWVVVCGALAISAMLLPGISGSYLLNILGMYSLILGSLVDLVTGLSSGYVDFQAFRIVLSMVLGICIGATLFARAIRYLLHKYRQETLALLVGFMLGALRAVWPFWTVRYELSALHLEQGPMLSLIDPVLPELASLGFCISSLAFLFGVALVFLVERMARMRQASRALASMPLAGGDMR